MSRSVLASLALIVSGCGSDAVLSNVTAACNGKLDAGAEEEVDDAFDLDGDGAFDGDNPDCQATYAAAELDCDDADPAQHPGADELCDGVDNDCDGLVDDEDDDALTSTFWADADGDGFGNADWPTEACSPPSDAVDNSADCDDGDDTVYPDAVELCDGLDNDCDGVVDDAEDAPVWYADTDSDGHGDGGYPLQACDLPSGYSELDDDCDDNDETVYPDADELCDGQDNDCDGLIDDDDDEVVDASTFYGDGDGDGWGDEHSSTLACDAPSGTVEDAGDCDDGDDSVNPDADELCNGIDDDCDGDTDEDDAVDASTFYADADGDGWGDSSLTSTACSAASGETDVAGDCDDADPNVNPAAEESCDGADEDCDAAVDEEASDAVTWNIDYDSDGFGADDYTVESCDQPTGYVEDDTDCDDTDGDTWPGADETCDEADDDCDGTVDEDAIDGSTWYADVDGDGYGDADSSTLGCDQPSSTVEDGTDCDDTDAGSYPGAGEVSGDGADNDCDSSVDEDPCNNTCSGSWDATAASELEELEYCNEVTGSLKISGSDITDLDPLTCLVTVGSTFEVSGTTALTDGSALGALTTVTGDVKVQGNEVLADLDLSGLETVGGYLTVYDNEALEALDLGGLRALGTSFSVYGNDALVSLDVSALDEATSFYVYSHEALETLAVDALAEVGGQLYVVNNDVLESLSGLELLETLEGGLEIYGNPELGGVIAIPLLERIEGSLTVYDNRALTELDLGALSQVDGSLRLSGNNELATVDLALLERVEGGGVIVYTNDALEALDLGALGYVGGSLQVYDHDALVSADVSAVETLTGSLYVTSNDALEELAFPGGLEEIPGSLYVVDQELLAGDLDLGSLVSVGSEVSVYDNLLLESVDLSALELVEGALRVSNCPELGGTLDLGALAATDGGITVYGNDALEAVELSGLEEVGGSLQVYSCDSLIDVDFGALTTLGGSLYVTGNELQETLSGLSAIAAVEGSLQITDLPQLTSAIDLGDVAYARGSVSLYDLDRIPALDLSSLVRSYDSLRISGNDLMAGDLDLAQLTDVDGSLNIYSNPLLTGLDLSALQEVEGSLQVYSHYVLDHLDLSSLSLVEGALYVVSNDELVTLSGLDLLESIGSTLTVSGNPWLEGALSFDALETIDSSVSVSANELLEGFAMPLVERFRADVRVSDLAGGEVDLSSLTQADGNLQVSGNPGMTTVSAEALETLGGNLYFYSNEVWSADLAMPLLTDIGGYVYVVDNDLLPGLDLGSLDTVADTFTISQNPVLPQCQAEALAAQLSSVGTVTISGNDEGASCP